MRLLALDCSSRSASCAIVEDGVLCGEFFTNVQQTHSQTLLPMLDSLLRQTGLTLADMDCFGVTHGPGSFTGLRIGVAVVKGMAHALKKPCVGVSTLEALAYALSGMGHVVAPMLDARRAQVYTALFRWEGARCVRMHEDAALSLEETAGMLKMLDSPVFLVGDGAVMCYNKLKDQLPQLCVAPTPILYTRASAAALACWERLMRGETVSVDSLAPCYLRLSQAERELAAKSAMRPCTE